MRELTALQKKQEQDVLRRVRESRKRRSDLARDRDWRIIWSYYKNDLLLAGEDALRRWMRREFVGMHLREGF